MENIWSQVGPSIGDYGNTSQASMSEWPLPVDIDRNGRINFIDFSIMARNWLQKLDWLE